MKLAIFDIDGVLANTVDLHTRALRNAIEFVVSTGAHQEAYLDAGDGIRTAEKLKRLAADYGLSSETIAMIDACKKSFTLKEMTTLKLDKNIVNGIKRLRKRGYTIAIASNSRRVFVNQIISAIGIAKLIDYSISGDEVSSPKPDPEIFNKVIAHFGADPKQTFIFEDSPNGIEAAVRSHANVIVVDPNLLVTQKQFDQCK